MARDKSESNPKDPRVQIISSIWGFTIAIAGISIPLTAITNGDALILPILATLGATVTSSIVWFSKGGAPPANPELEQAVTELSHRVAQLEIETRDIELRNAITHSTQENTAKTTQTPSQTQ